MTTILFVIAIFVSVWMGSINIAKAISREGIPFLNFILMSIGVTAVITHILNIW